MKEIVKSEVVLADFTDTKKLVSVVGHDSGTYGNIGNR